MKYQDFVKKVYKILSGKLIAVPSGNNFSAFHYASRQEIDKMTGEYVNLYCPLAASDKQLDLRKKGPTQIWAMNGMAHQEIFEMRKRGVLEFNMEVTSDGKEDCSYEKTISAMANDIYVEACRTLASKLVEKEDSVEKVNSIYKDTILNPEVQENFLEFLSGIDAMEIVSTSSMQPVYSNAGGFIHRMKFDANYRVYKAILLTFSAKNANLRPAVEKQVNRIKRAKNKDADELGKEPGKNN